MYKDDIMSYFPTNDIIKGPRGGQTAVLQEIDKVLKAGKKFIILEGPVGCGKSAIAITLARAFEHAHLITPRKSLQDQYFEDFKEHAVLMKGRGAYPCTFGVTPARYKKIAIDVVNGQVRQPGLGEPNCSVAPCKGSRQVYQSCNQVTGTCPYTLATETAQKHECVIHNIHSFVFQTAFTEKFDKRSLLVVDEAHEIESTIRGFISRKFSVNIVVQPQDRPSAINDVESWSNFFADERFIPKLSAGELNQKKIDPEWISPDVEYLNRVENLRAQKDYYKDKFSVKAVINKVGNRDISTTFEFIPEYLGNAPRDFLFDYGDHVLLMSGTIYDKNIFCKNLSINPEEVHFIRIPSTFPVENRPIYIKPEYQVDTSFKGWDENFQEMIDKMSKIMTIFGDAKGLIHAPSYDAAVQIVQALPGTRAVTHSSHDFQEKLKQFYESDEPLVFVSPVCQQGVDFKEDRSRFQIITRVPYLNTSDEFVNFKVQNDFPWYNYQALIVWGQQLGRVNRSENDYGATFLMDSRFNSFISRNLKIIPKWARAAFIYK